jgi:hypothetical protein
MTVWSNDPSMGKLLHDSSFLRKDAESSAVHRLTIQLQENGHLLTESPRWADKFSAPVCHVVSASRPHQDLITDQQRECDVYI